MLQCRVNSILAGGTRSGDGLVGLALNLSDRAIKLLTRGTFIRRTVASGQRDGGGHSAEYGGQGAGAISSHDDLLFSGRAGGPQGPAV